MKLKDKVVVITGGSRGQGAAEARLFQGEGGRVIIGDVLVDEGIRLARELGPGVDFMRLDVAEPADWEKVIARATELGGLYGLVNNAGVFNPQPILETPLGEFERHYRVNQLGPFLGMQAAIPAMALQGVGSIVNVSSSAGLRATPEAFAYSATKWALRGMTKAAAVGAARSGIRINSIHPGPIDTEMLSVRTPEQMAERLSRVPMPRMGTADEVAQLVLFLLSEDSSYITGAEISVDGGAVL